MQTLLTLNCVRHNIIKQLPLLIMIFSFISSYGQTEIAKIFQKIEYVDGDFYKQLYDTIKLKKENIDIYFFRNHFYTPYYLPDRFIDKQYKNKTVSIWRDANAKKDYRSNWENTYTYDSLSRVTNYTYSGCIICSNMPYNYIVTYNSSGQVDVIKNTISEKDSYRFYYNNTGDLIQFEKYSSDLLETRIIVVR